MSGEDSRPDLHALLELQALLGEIVSLRNDGSGERFDQDARYRWVLNRLWIAAGNEALAYTHARGQQVRTTQPWANLYQLRNYLAHQRSPDVDETVVRRITWMGADDLRAQVEQHLRPTE